MPCVAFTAIPLELVVQDVEDCKYRKEAHSNIISNYYSIVEKNDYFRVETKQ